ncbi:MAG: PTS glucitol/sorbitol transporter subunit IIC [Streptococcus salivarius]
MLLCELLTKLSLLNSYEKKKKRVSWNQHYKITENFMKLFQLGGETFISWMTNIVPLVLMLLIAMNTLIAFLEKRRSIPWLPAKNPVTRYMICLSFQPLLWGTRCQSVWDVLPEYYKPSL